mmetsp:Transcript_1072/g.1504  ORF Transcript_1072/g.1504 Transcript_1072/m.1504 type:complete len:1554 (+) Transcript_1072:136-4797(+)
MDIFEASREGDVKQLIHILDECPNDIDERNSQRYTPLIIACIYNQYVAAKILIEKGADLLATDKESGWTPLHHCIYNGHFAIGALIVNAKRHHWEAALGMYSPPLTPMKPQGGSLRKRTAKKQKLKRGMMAVSRNGFRYRLKSPLEITDHDLQTPYDLLHSPVVHGGTFRSLETKSKFGKVRKARSSSVSSLVLDLRNQWESIGAIPNLSPKLSPSEPDEKLIVTPSYDWACYSFGKGTNYQLGYSTQNTLQVKPKKIEMLDGKNICSVTSDEFSSFAIATDGSCYSWGLGHGGRLGLGTSKTKRFQIEPCKMIAFGENIKITAIRTYADVGGAISSSGSLYIWGKFTWGDEVKEKNMSKSLEPNLSPITLVPKKEGKNNGNSLSTPRRVMSSHKFISLSMSEGRMLLVSTDYKLYILGKSPYTDKFHSSPSLMKDFEKIKISQCVSTNMFIAVRTLNQEVLLQECGGHNIQKIHFPKCIGFEKQAMLKQGEVKSVRICHIDGDVNGHHLLAVSILGNLFSWSHPAYFNNEFPVNASNCEHLSRYGARNTPNMSPSLSAMDSPVLTASNSKRRRSSKYRLVAQIVPGLSRVKVRQACISSTYAALTTSSGDLYTWGSGCIGHGKQTTIHIPTRIHKLRQIHHVSISSGHTIVVQRIRRPTPTTHHLSTILYHDPYTILSREKISLINVAEDALSTSTSCCNPNTVLKIYKMALCLHLPRLVKYCIRYILLNCGVYIPQALNTLNMEELQQLEFYWYVWKSDPLMDLSSHASISKCLVSHMHQSFHSREQDAQRSRIEEFKIKKTNDAKLVQNSPHLKFSGSPESGSMPDLIEIVTGESGKKHARVVLRVKKRYRELRKKLKQIQHLKQKKELDSEQKTKVGLENDFQNELNGLRKALRYHAAGRDFLDRMKGGDEINTPKMTPTRPPLHNSSPSSLSLSASPQQTIKPLSLGPAQLSLGDIVDSAPGVNLCLVKSTTKKDQNIFQTSSVLSEFTTQITNAESASTMPKNKSHRESKRLSNFEKIQEEQRKEEQRTGRRLFNPTPQKSTQGPSWGKGGRSLIFSRLSNGTPPKSAIFASESNESTSLKARGVFSASKKADDDEWKPAQTRRSKRQNSPSLAPSPILSHSNSAQSFEGMGELELPKQLVLADYVDVPKKGVSKSQSSPQMSSINPSHNILKQRSWSLLSLNSSTKSAKQKKPSLLEIQRQQKQQSAESQMRRMPKRSTTPQPVQSLSTQYQVEHMYAPPVLNLGLADFIKAKPKANKVQASTSMSPSPKRLFSWGTPKNKAEKKIHSSSVPSKATKIFTGSENQLSNGVRIASQNQAKSLLEIMNEQKSLLIPQTVRTQTPSAYNAWIRKESIDLTRNANAKGLAEIQSLQLVEEIVKEKEIIAAQLQRSKHWRAKRGNRKKGGSFRGGCSLRKEVNSRGGVTSRGEDVSRGGTSHGRGNSRGGTSRGRGNSRGGPSRGRANFCGGSSGSNGSWRRRNKEEKNRGRGRGRGVRHSEQGRGHGSTRGQRKGRRGKGRGKGQRGHKSKERKKDINESTRPQRADRMP